MASLAKRVLVVDDENEQREALRYLLEMWGFESEGAGDGAQAFELVATFKPDVVVLDLGLPDTGGAEAIRRIREAGTAVIVVFSGWHRLREVVLAAGADAFVLKPDLDALETAVRSATAEPASTRKKQS
jgi:DNA-binding response OmpR family regulator